MVDDQVNQGHLRDTLESTMEQHRVGMGFARQARWFPAIVIGPKTMIEALFL